MINYIKNFDITNNIYSIDTFDSIDINESFEIIDANGLGKHFDIPQQPVRQLCLS